MNQIDRAFFKLLGKACWEVRTGSWTYLTLEFGKPKLVTREAISPSKDTSKRIRRLLERRLISVRGEWHMWIYSCDWVVRVKGRVVGDSTSRRRMEAAARVLSGQKLIGVETRARGARTTFKFDLGAELETKPYDRSGEQWMLFGPKGSVIVWRADRMVGHGRGKLRWSRLAG